MYPIVLDDEFLYSYVSVPSVRLSCMDVDLKVYVLLKFLVGQNVKKKNFRCCYGSYLGIGIVTCICEIEVLLHSAVAD